MTAQRFAATVAVAFLATVSLIAFAIYRGRSRGNVLLPDGAPRVVPLPDPEPETHAFGMCVTHARDHDGGNASLRLETWSEPVLAAVVRSLEPAEQKGLEEALELARTRWEARANPLLDDIEGVDPDSSLEAWFKSAPSFVRAAQGAARLRVCAPDGFCATPENVRGCPPGWSKPPTKSESDRARFLVWPWGHALRAKPVHREQMLMIAGQVRDQARRSKRIAVVLASDDDRVTHQEPYVKIRDLWVKTAILRKIALGERKGDPIEKFEVNLADDELIVLPRLGAVQDAASFEEEVREAMSPLTK